MRCLVVCTFGETIASFSPSNAFNSVLLPAFGLPNMFTNPAFIVIRKDQDCGVVLLFNKVIKVQE
jgi:hypothetical protein